MDDLKIGDFTQPVVPAKPAARATAQPQSSAAPKIPASPDEVALGAEASAIEADLVPMRTYEDQLRDAGVSREEAARIVDAIMTQGAWAEDVRITRSVSARLRTRSSLDRTRAMSRVETARPTYDAHYYDLLNKLLLAASLESFGSMKFSHPPRDARPEDVEAAFDTRFKYLDAVIADPAYQLLLRAFLKFEDKIRVVTQEGVVENF